MSSHRSVPAAILGLLLFIAAVAQAATLNVPADYADLQDALDVAVAGDTVLVGPGTWLHDLQPSPEDLVQTRYIVYAPIVLAGATGMPDDVVLDGQGHGRVLTCVAGLSGLVIRDLTIAGGNTTSYGPTDGAGAGLVTWNCDIELVNCVVRENVIGWKNAGGGGGVHMDGGTVLVQGCVFRDNLAGPDDGGFAGGLSLVGATGQVLDCLFERNAAASSGALAIHNDSGTAPSDVTVTLCRFEHNIAAVFGGAVTVSQWCTAHFEKCLFLGNEAQLQNGGALLYGDAEVTLQSCRFEGNTAVTEGGAVYGAYWAGPVSNLELLDCTLVDNAAGTAGGAIHLLANATLYGWNTNFSGNEAPAGADLSVVTGGEATLACCLTAPDMWVGPVTLDNSDCTVATEDATWGGVKALFR